MKKQMSVLRRSSMVAAVLSLGLGVHAGAFAQQAGEVLKVYNHIALSGGHVMVSSMNPLPNPIAFNTDSLPEGGNVIVSVGLDKSLTPAQQRLINDYDLPKTTAVLCESVEVIRVAFDRSGRQALVANGKDCALKHLEAGIWKLGSEAGI